jgi:hypothetical protein
MLGMGLTHNILGAASSGARLAALLVYPGYFSRDCGVVLFVLGRTLALKPKGSTTNLQQGGETPSFEIPLPPLVI